MNHESTIMLAGTGKVLLLSSGRAVQRPIARASEPCVSLNGSPRAYSGTGIASPNFRWAKNAQLRVVHGVEPKRSPGFRIPKMCVRI